MDSNMRVATNVGDRSARSNRQSISSPNDFQPVALSVLRRMLERASDLVSRHHPDAGRRSIHMAALELRGARRAEWQLAGVVWVRQRTWAL